ncbi:MAG: class III poly(R)-hydroxyalkanoic acid synthase subunit PhaC [Firmicutes bacterium]|nr:class III poly(R)-hydroxyalkanoic acid synthase subunit PhaC [Bacillota bacterium]
MQNFDYKGSAEYAMNYMQGVIKGLDNMMNMSADMIRTGELEKEEVLNIGKMKMYHYKPLVEESKLLDTPMLITYALVNKQYMMDLQPDRSVIKAFLEKGIDTYIIDWGYPAKEDLYLTLEDHIEWYMDECVDYIIEESGQPQITLLGVCQGGTFSTIYTALHQDKIKNFVSMVTPIDFSIEDGLLFKWSRYFSIDKMVDAYENVPADLMNSTFVMLKPFELIVDKYVGFGAYMWDLDYLANFMRTENWIFDSPDQAGETIRKFVNDLYVDNKLVKGEFILDGKEVNLENIECPLLVVCAKYDHLVPPSSTKPLMDAVSSTDKEFHMFDVGHVGMYISPNSKNEIAPVIGDWIAERS